MAAKIRINLSELSQALSRAFVRFPLAIIMAITASTLACYMVNIKFSEVKNLLPYVSTAYLGIPLFIATSLLGESFKTIKGYRFIELSGILLLPFIFTYLDNNDEYFRVTRTLHLALTFHLLVAIAGYLKSKNSRHFWQFNQNILLRFLLTAFYSAILYGGLSLALLALQLLFGVDFDKVYVKLFLVISSAFNTWFFCSGIPDSLEEEVVFPKGLKVFTQYVLIPLVIIYLLILYAYTGKIIIEWEWPIGWVSTLILGFSVCGILAYLLVFPILQEDRNRWLKRIIRGIFIALIPLIFLMALSVLRRISDYGITEERYYLANLVIWLAFVALVFGIFKSEKIKWIPISLLLIALVNLGGPISALEVSVRNQKGRLISNLKALELYKDGKWIQSEKGSYTHEEYESVNGPLEYLTNRKRLNEIQDILPDNSDSLLQGKRIYAFKESRVIMKKMNMMDTSSENAEYDRYIHFERKNKSYDVAGEEYDVQFNLRNMYHFSQTEEKRNGIKFSFSIEKGKINLDIDNENYTLPLLNRIKQSFNVQELKGLSELDDNYSDDKATFYFDCGKHKVKVVVDHFSIYTKKEEELNNIDLMVWIKLNP